MTPYFLRSLSWNFQRLLVISLRLIIRADIFETNYQGITKVKTVKLQNLRDFGSLSMKEVNRFPYDLGHDHCKSLKIVWQRYSSSKAS